MEIEDPKDSHLEAHDNLSCAPESENDAAFREKIKSIMFPGRGKADRSKSISRHGKDVSNADRERRARH